MRVTHDAQIAQVVTMSSWLLSAQIAQVVGGVVVAAPWELHAFVVPAAMCSRLVARRGRRALCAGSGVAVAAP
jgi:hypothetical protein